MTDENEYDRRAMDALNGDRHLFLTGRAGTGKTTLIRHWLDEHAPEGTLVCAPTGVAALNAGGVTIHRLIHCGPDATVEHARRQGRARRAEPLERRLACLVIDEVSMVRSDLIDCLDAYLQAAKGDGAPFGGVRLVMVGDLAQLPPVVAGDDRRLFGDVWDGPWFFQGRSIGRLMKEKALDAVELTRIHRQADRAFTDALNAVRDGGDGLTQALELVNTRATGRWDARGAVVLAAANRRADLINRLMLDRLPGPETIRDAVIDGDWDPRLTPAPRGLALRDGMRVMTLSNDPDGRWVNGSTGTLTRLDPDGAAHVLLDTGRAVTVGRHTWTRARPVVKDGPNGARRIVMEPSGTYTQLPLRPGWAVTIHKSQGKTLDKVHLELGERPLFAPGQAYVALSRATHLDGLTLDRPLTAADVITDPAPQRFLDALAA